MNWKKGIEYTLEALKIVQEKGYDFQYYIVGDGPEMERLQFAVYQLGLNKRVFFLGKLAPSQVRKEMELSTFGIQYSLQEGFCNAILEAQAMGLLCLVSDAEGLPENIINNETGFVIPKRNPSLLAIKIIEIFNLSSSEKEIIKHKAINRIANDFTIQKQINQFLDFYNNL